MFDKMSKDFLRLNHTKPYNIYYVNFYNAFTSIYGIRTKTGILPLDKPS